MNRDINCLSDLFIEIGGLIKIYEDNMKVNQLKEDTKQLCGITEVIKIYPSLSKYILTNAINDGLLPVTWVGNERHFYISDIEAFLQTRTQKNKAHSLTSWRTSEQA